MANSYLDMLIVLKAQSLSSIGSFDLLMSAYFDTVSLTTLNQNFAVITPISTSVNYLAEFLTISL